MTPQAFQSQVLAWFDLHGRKDLPWQIDRTPYRVWISEIMLQQTQVATVIPFFQRFMARFPDLLPLAEADIEEVIAHWAGLGYYARARNLHRAARQLRDQHQGRFPQSRAVLESLPGIGRSTAGAILSLGLHQPAAILDGNVKRVLSRFAGIEGWSGQSEVLARLWHLSESLTPDGRVADYNQAMMDLGAMICTRSRPDCAACPLAEHCRAHLTGRTAVIPAPRPKRAMPVRNGYLLLLEHTAGPILLEQRPPQGIWGGLRSLPEFDSLQALHAWCRRQQIDIEKLSLLATRRHTFSHYHFDFVPVLAYTDRLDLPALSERLGWFDRAHASGLPAPVKTLLAEQAPIPRA